MACSFGWSRFHPVGALRDRNACYAVSVADRCHSAGERRGLDAVAGLSRQEGRHRLRARRQRGNALGVAPCLEQPEVRPVGLAGAECFLRLRQIDRKC
jgi:hypothetical protein